MNSLWALCLLFTALCYWEWIGRLHASQFPPKKLELCSIINNKRSLSFIVLFIYSEFLITCNALLPSTLASTLSILNSNIAMTTFLVTLLSFTTFYESLFYVVIHVSTTQIYLLLKLIHNCFLWIMFDTVTYYKVLKAGAMFYIHWKNIITQ